MSRQRKSEESYERFHDAKPKGWKKVRIPDLPERAWKLGELVALVYEPQEPSKKRRTQYEHQFGDRGTIFFDKNKPVLYSDESGQQLIIVKGKSKYYVDPDRGIVG